MLQLVGVHGFDKPVMLHGHVKKGNAFKKLTLVI